MRLTLILIKRFLVLVPLTLCAQENIKFEHYTLDEGLSQMTVGYIIQDHQGFMWFATTDGLNRFDGYSFKVYKHDPQIATSISDNFNLCLLQDRNNYIWVGTNDGGLNRFDPQTEKFRHFKHDPQDSFSLSDNHIWSLAEDSSGFIWVGTTSGGLNRYDPDTETFTHYRHDPSDPESLGNDQLTTLLIDRSGTLWLGTVRKGLDRFVPGSGKFRHFRHDPRDPGSLSDNHVLGIYEDRAGNLWIGTRNGGINLLTKENRDAGRYRFDHIRHDPANPASLGPGAIWDFSEDENGELWIATSKSGLNRYSPSNGVFTRYEPDASEPTSINYIEVRCIYRDNSGNFWAGTFNGGVNKFNPHTKKFHHIMHDPNDPESLSGNTVWSICKDSQNTLWVGTYGAGLNRFDRKTQSFIHYGSVSGKRNSLSSNFVWGLAADKDGIIWIGTLREGMSKLNPTTGRIRHYRFEEEAPKGTRLNNATVSVIVPDEGILWIGTWGGGLNRFDPRTERFTYYVHDPKDSTSISHNAIYCMMIGREGELWIGTHGGGLNLFDPQSSKFKTYRHVPHDRNSLSNDRVFAVHQDSQFDDVIWVGTYGGGLNRLALSDGSIERFTEQDGLANNSIYAIVEDSKGNLWITTNNGLTKMNPGRDGKGYTYKNYYADDGLQSNEFNGAFFQSADGYVYFGGINGFNVFHPDSIRDNSFIPPVVYTDFKIFNEPVPIRDSEGILSRSIRFTKEIEISYRESVISFEFTALNYTFSNKNEYKYKLEGFNDNWIHLGNKHDLTFTNLDPGDYVLHVKGSNNDGIWNEVPASLIITVTPPFWKTAWFILLMIVSAGGGIAYFVYYRVQQLLAIERLRTKIAADLHDSIGSGLTEISILGDVTSAMLSTKENQTVSSNLRKISDVARSLVENMSDIVWLVSPQKDSLYDLMIRLRDGYEELMGFKGIRLITANLKSLEDVRLPMEFRQNLYMIFKEAMNNCIKYSQCDEVNLSASVSNKMLVVSLRDNGVGFDSSVPHRSLGGNGLINIQKRARQLDGELLIESQPSHGTSIEFRGEIG